MEPATQMNVQDSFEILVRHLIEGSAANDACIVDENIDPAVTIQRRLDHRFAALGCRNRLGACDGIAPRYPDLLDHLFCGSGIGSLPVHTDARVIDNDLRSPRREKLGIATSQTSAGTRDHRDASIEPEL
jgi:hypothetical protein